MTTLYIVDDHRIMREGLRALLTAGGHTVVGESADLTTALADIQRLKPTVLLLDLHLEGRSGLELLADMRQRKMDIRCVVLTMLAQPRMVAESLRMGAQGYVLKGSAGSELTYAIDAAVRGRRYMGTGVAELAELAEQSSAQNDQINPMENLSPRERQIITMVVKGQSSVRIGALLHLSPKTVATYRSRLMHKLEVHDVPSLVRLAIRHKLLDAH
jgi:DNA-binding NarL/FixJ family response regulator